MENYSAGGNANILRNRKQNSKKSESKIEQYSNAKDNNQLLIKNNFLSRLSTFFNFFLIIIGLALLYIVVTKYVAYVKLYHEKLSMFSKLEVINLNDNKIRFFANLTNNLTISFKDC